MIRKLALASAFGIGFSLAPAYAQTVDSEVQRDVDQQERIEQGLKSGELTTGEAARLEHGEAAIDHSEAAADRNGDLSSAEAARIQTEQNRESAAIYDLKHNSATGNPDSLSSERLQADVQRNIDQQSRIQQGVNSGSLTTRETGRLEAQQGRIANREAYAGAFGHVGWRAQGRIQRAENRASGHIWRAKHD